MKIVTKTFYIDQGFFLMLLSSYKNNCEFQKDLAQFFLKNYNGKMREIQISWQEPERRLEISENDFDKAFEDAFKLRGYSKDFFIELKERLFNQ